ncbi:MULTISPECIES: hypothetical protein [Mycolicibacterium]|uniref:hypothetical protein n=1 Tax=Mycolicibacterium TaxID=1866885 RepID=UPI00104222F9|nr:MULTISPECIES: hypothetical protein [Mycolicibacterium]
MTHPAEDKAREDVWTAAYSGPSEQLAWRLAESLLNSLSVQAKNLVFVQLGCRHYRRAIAEALQAAIHQQTPIPDDLATDLACWLRRYRGHTDQARIVELLARAPRQDALR